MTDPATPAPGWYPDPTGSGGLRYWDGIRWTEHLRTHNQTPTASGEQSSTPAHHTPATSDVISRGNESPTTPKARRKLRGRWLVAGTAAVVALTVAAVGVVFLNPFSPREPTAATATSTGTTTTQVSYKVNQTVDYARPRVVKPDESVELPADYDVEAVCMRGLQQAGETPSERSARAPCTQPAGSAPIAKLFVDPSLTKQLSIVLNTSLTGGGPIKVSPREMIFLKKGDQSLTLSNPGDWGLYPEYYLVQYLDRTGGKLTRPLVTKITVAGTLSTPRVAFIKERDGSVTLKWSKVRGAREYYVVTGKAIKSTGSRDLDTLGNTTATTWSSASLDRPDGVRQNHGLEVFAGGDAEEIENGNASRDDRYEAYDIGVIAVGDNKKHSAYYSYDLAAQIGDLPLQEATMTNIRAIKNHDDVTSFQQLPTRFNFISLDGALRSVTARMDPKAFSKEYGTDWYANVSGVGTKLHYKVRINGSVVPKTFADGFNKAARADAARTGGDNAITITSLDKAVTGGTKTPPPTKYPVYGSNPLTLAIAQHLIGQTELMNVEDLANRPGAPDLEDAFREAISQNPHAGEINYSLGMTIAADNTFIKVKYKHTLTETQKRQKTLMAKVDEVVKATVREDMSDQQKVTALNNWLVNHAEYDYAAFDALQSGETGYRTTYANAWLPDGVLLNGKGVCASYSQAFTLLANAAGVKTVYVTGNVTKGGPHAWNKSLVNGAWKAIDVTWNDSTPRNKYLLIADSQFTGSAQRSEDNRWMVDTYISQFAAK